MQPIDTQQEQTDEDTEFKDCNQGDLKQKLPGKSLKKQLEEAKRQLEFSQRELRELRELVTKNNPKLTIWTSKPINNSLLPIQKLRYQIKTSAHKEELEPKITTVGNVQYTNRPIGKNHKIEIYYHEKNISA